MNKMNLGEKLTPSIVQADKKFAEQIHARFALPPELPEVMIMYFRDAIRNPFNYCQRKIDPDAELKIDRAYALQGETLEICIKSSSGTICLDKLDKHFKYFLGVVKKMRDDFRKDLPETTNEYKLWLLEGYISLLDKMLKEKCHHTLSAALFH
jgi:hypothetical protein